MSKHIHAIIRFLTTSEGGKTRLPRSGYKPLLDLGDELTSVTITSLVSDDEIFELGKEYEVDVEIHFWDHYHEQINLSAPFKLFEGPKFTVGVGRFLDSKQ